MSFMGFGQDDDYLRSLIITLVVVAVFLFFAWLTYKPLHIDGRDCFTVGIMGQVHCL